MKKDGWFIKTFMNPWFVASVVCLFAACGFGFSIDSYYADTHNANGLFVVLTVLFGLGFFYCMAKANETSTGEGG
jgi:putative effector of murein hydrolase